MENTNPTIPSSEPPVSQPQIYPSLPPDNPAQPLLPQDSHNAPPPQVPNQQPYNQPPKIIKNPFKNMAVGFIKFAKTNLLLSFLYFIIFIILYVAATDGLGNLLSSDSFSSIAGFAPVTFAILLLSGLLLSCLILVLSKLMLEGVRGNKISISHSFSVMKKSWVLLIYYIAYFVIIILLGVTVFAAIGGAANLSGIGLAFLGLLVVGIYLLIKWAFTFLCIVDYPDSGPLNSIHRSAQLTKGHRLSIFVYYLLSFGVGIVIAVLSGNGLQQTYSSYDYSNSAVNYSASSGGSRDIVIGIVEGVLGVIFYAGFTELYRQIKDGSQPFQTAHPSGDAPQSPVASSPPTPPV